nr:MAG TPA: tail collar fiber protein [Caudoviricetes sp.]
MAFGRPALTLAGKTLMAKVLAGDTLKFTKMKMGDGSLSGSNPAELSDLIKPVATITTENVKKGSNYIAVKGTFDNKTVQAGFYWREFGLFAQDKDRGEILFAYANAGTLADYIAAATTSEIVKTLTAVIAAADAENINVTLDTSIVYARAEDLEKITEIVEKIIGQSIPDSGSGGTIVINSSGIVTLTHTYTAPNHAFTGLGGRTGLIPAQFKATAGYTEGDTATIDGIAYTIQLTGADAPETDLFVTGKSILVDIDTEGKTINFKAGGGLTKAKLSLADATEGEVFAGKTFYAGGKELRTGTYDPDWAIKKSW